MQEKEDKGLRDFSGSKSDDLEERLQVVCLPKLSRGVVHDVKEVRCVFHAARVGFGWLVEVHFPAARQRERRE